MQRIFADNQEAVKLFRATLSDARFASYLAESNGNEIDAINLYLWNARLSQSMYFPLQTWEIALRNKLNTFMSWKYSSDWPYNSVALRQLTGHENRKLKETIDRQRQIKSVAKVPTDAIVADLSAGFWVGLLAKAYEVPYSWRYNLVRIFPNDRRLQRSQAHDLCADLLDLRNRVAHHEPIWHWALDELRADLDYLLESMCKPTNAYVRIACTFEDIWNAGPDKQPPPPAQPPPEAT